ncbi:MAG: hypothetical protein EU539_13960 [Promethearchaeota archaeon]|nr:MAG: hypothetical protein EU539_13960 [Candidatus Lokiarchaeota archaeon]
MEFKLWKFIWTGIVGMLLMIPIAYTFFYLFDMPRLLTGGLIQNFFALGSAIGPLIFFFIAAFLGVFIICLVPIHWVIIYTPGDLFGIDLLLAIALPWIACCSLMALLTSKNFWDGIFTSLAIGLGFFIVMLVIYLGASVILAPIGGGAILDGIAIGLSDSPFLLAAFLATMEGAGTGCAFAALIGSIKQE